MSSDERGHLAAGAQWIDLPAPWSAGPLVAALRDEEILVAPGDDHAADRTLPAHGIRVGLNAEVSDDALRRGLEAVARVMSGGPTAS